MEFQQEAFVRSTALLTATFLGSAIVPAWCPEPADLKSSRARGTGATAAVSTPQCEDGPRPELCKLKYSRKYDRPNAMNRMSGSPINPAGSGKNERPSATAAAKPAGGGAVLAPSSSSSAMDRLGGGSSHAPSGVGIKKTDARTQQAQPRVSVTPGGSSMDRMIDYGGCAGCKKPDTFRQPR